MWEGEKKCSLSSEHGTILIVRGIGNHRRQRQRQQPVAILFPHHPIQSWKSIRQEHPDSRVKAIKEQQHELDAHIWESIAMPCQWRTCSWKAIKRYYLPQLVNDDAVLWLEKAMNFELRVRERQSLTFLRRTSVSTILEVFSTNSSSSFTHPHQQCATRTERPRNRREKL